MRKHNILLFHAILEQRKRMAERMTNMGMFDHLECKMKLPDTTQEELDDFESGNLFQTKSLDCFMLQYSIDENGILYKDDLPENYTGHITFYTLGKKYVMAPSIIPGRGEYKKHNWYEYEMLIVHGKVESIIRIKREEIT